MPTRRSRRPKALAAAAAGGVEVPADLAAGADRDQAALAGLAFLCLRPWRGQRRRPHGLEKIRRAAPGIPVESHGSQEGIADVDALRRAILDLVSFQAVADNLRESFRIVAASRAGGEIRELAGVSIASAAATFQM